MILYVVFLLTNFTYIGFLDEPFLLPKKLVLCFLSVTMLIWKLYQKDVSKTPIHSRWAWPTLLMIFGIFVASFRSPLGWYSFYEGLFFISLIPIFILGSTELSESTPQKEKILNGLFTVAKIQIALGIFQLAYIAIVGDWHQLRHERFFAGTFGNSEYFAYFLGIILLLAFRFKKSNSFKLLIIAALMATRCKSAWGAVLLSLIFFYDHPLLTKNKRLIIGTGLTLSLIVLGYLEFLSGFKGRLLLNLLSLNSIWSNSFLGNGFGSVKFDMFANLQKVFQNSFVLNNFSKYAPLSERTHNEFLDFLHEGGLIFLYGILFLAYQFFKSRKFDDSITKCLFSFLSIMCLLSFPLHIPENAVLTILVFHLLSTAQKEGDNSTYVFRINFSEATAFFSLILLIPLVGFTRQAYASYLYKNAEQLVSSRRLNEAEPLLKTSLELYLPSINTHRLNAILAEKKSRSLANDFLNQAWNRGITAIDIIKLRAYILSDMGHLDESFSEFKKISLSYPLQTTPYFKMAIIRQKQNRKEEAKVLYEKVTQMKPTSSKGKIEKFFSYYSLSTDKN